MSNKITTALKTKKGDFTISEVKIPKLKKTDWVLARARVAGICDTDLRHWKKEDSHLECRIPSASYSYWGIYPEMQICLDLLAKGRLNTKKMITHCFPIEEINKVFSTARDKEHSNALFVALTIT